MEYMMSVLDTLYPYRNPIKESDSLSPLHPVIPGESVLFLGEIRAGVISLSNYRYTLNSNKYVPLHFISIEKTEEWPQFADPRE